MTASTAPMPQKALAMVNQSARWKPRIIEKCGCLSISASVRKSAEADHLFLALGQAPLEVVDVGAALLEADVGHDALLQRHVGLDAVHDHFRQRDLHAADR